jgi:hypothetical protein
MSASTGLNAGQRRAIAALLTGATHQEAATSARKSIRTVRRWLEDDRFRGELANGSREIMRAAVERLQQGSDRAAAALVGMSDGQIPYASARVAACAKVLELARDHGEVDELRQLVDELAVAVAGMKGGIQ